jgi:hypothetical protein
MGGGLNRKRVVHGALRRVAGQGCWVGDGVSDPRAVKTPRQAGIDPRPPKFEARVAVEDSYRLILHLKAVPINFQSCSCCANERWVLITRAPG